MNPHSLQPSHSRSTLQNDTPYLSSHNNARYYSSIYRPPPHTMSQHPHHQASHTRQHHTHTYPNAPWNAPAVVPPPVLQEVYILDCRSCNTFLTNRGMRAVLLLQPEVPLYSTDALPVNCSATPAPPEYAPSYETITASSSNSSCPSGMPVPRTCECLTQTLCCHGCGNAVGYMVVIPCTRCCSSVSPTNRHTNRHRFVFFNKEITAIERRYIPHEPGIITTSPLLVSAITPSSSISPSSSFSTLDPSTPSSSSASHYNPSHTQHPTHTSESVPPLPTPPPESPMSIDHPTQASPPGQNQHQRSSFPTFQFIRLKPERGKLRAGDVVYWHNLARNGEIPAVVEDERARNTRESIKSQWAGR